MATNATVTITYDPTGKPPLTINTPDAQVQGPGCVTWVLQAASDQAVVVQFTAGCPFGSAGDASNPTAGEYICGNAAVTTLPATYSMNGIWPYKVSLLPSGKVGPTTADGTVVVADNP
jgi:hypothetical protein